MVLNVNLYRADAFHVIRSYVLDNIRADLEMLRLADGYPIDPFVPTQQPREFADLGAGMPFVVYSYSSSNKYPEWWLKQDTASLRIYGDSDEQLRILKSYIADILARQSTPDDLTDYANSLSMSIMRIFDFKTMEVLTSMGPDLYEQEGGRMLATIVIRYEYTESIGSTLMRSLE